MAQRQRWFAGGFQLRLVAAMGCSGDVQDNGPTKTAETSTAPWPAPEVPSPTSGRSDGSSSGDTAGQAATSSDATTSVGGSSGGNPPGESVDGPRTVLVHLFEWRWEDVAQECELVVGPAGFGGVQVSPPQEYALIDGSPWWERYQPVSYELIGRSGDAQSFADMVQRCAEVGVDIYVDAVLNHMAFGTGNPGFGGTQFEKYDYPGLYTVDNFHSCRRGIEDWNSRSEIHNCELATLPDLATEQPYVRDRLSDYLQSLLDVGVKGFRLDGAKHMPAADIEAILSGLEPAPAIYQEVIHLGDHEVVRAEEYTALGRVTEFRYGMELSSVFRTGQLAWLGDFGAAWGFVPSEDALVFVDNHDNQRGHGAGDPIVHTNPGLYRVAIAFMLAWPYGQARVMSSYRFADGFEGPPRNDDGSTRPALTGPGDCQDGWICEHRWESTLGMVGFRNATANQPVMRWWTNGNDQIAFARGHKGFFVLNREELPTLAQPFATGLEPGRYCDVVSGGMDPQGQRCQGAQVLVEADGWAQFVVPPLDAVAIHVQARLD